MSKPKVIGIKSKVFWVSTFFTFVVVYVILGLIESVLGIKFPGWFVLLYFIGMFIGTYHKWFNMIAEIGGSKERLIPIYKQRNWQWK